MQIIYANSRSNSIEVQLKEKLKTGKVYVDRLPRKLESFRKKRPISCKYLDMTTTIDDYWKVTLSFEGVTKAEVSSILNKNFK